MKRLQITLLAVAAVAFLAADAAAQTQGKFLVEGHGGYQFQTGDITDYVDPGFTFGASVGYGIGEAMSIWVGGDYALLQGKEGTEGSFTLPDWKVGTLMAWFGYDFTQASQGKSSFIGMVGAGASNWNIDQENPNQSEGVEDKTFATVGVQLKFAYWASEQVAIVINGVGNYAFTDYTSTDGTELIKGTFYFPFSGGVMIAF